MSMYPHGCFRRLAIPEFSHGDRLKTIDEGVIQELRGSTVSGTSGRHETLPCENIPDGRGPAKSVMYYILLEYPFLEFV